MNWRVIRWRAYSLLMTATFAAGLFNHGSTSFLRYAGEAGMLIAVVGLSGYATGRRLIAAGFWQVMLPLAIAGIACGLLDFCVRESGRIAAGLPQDQTAVLAGVITASIVTALLTALLTPMLIAVYRYGFRCDRFWGAGKPQTGSGARLGATQPPETRATGSPAAPTRAAYHGRPAARPGRRRAAPDQYIAYSFDVV